MGAGFAALVSLGGSGAMVDTVLRGALFADHKQPTSRWCPPSLSRLRCNRSARLLACSLISGAGIPRSEGRDEEEAASGFGFDPFGRGALAGDAGRGVGGAVVDDG